MTYDQAITSPTPVKLTVEDYLMLERCGAFDRFSKTELIDGEIVAVNSQFSEHMKVKNVFYRRLADACDRLGGGFEAWSEGSVNMAPDSMPMPDLLVTTQTPAKGSVPLATIALVGEVSDTSVRYDLKVKAPLYARKGVPEYWVIDIPAALIHQFWQPAGDGYTERRQIAFGSPVTAATIGGLTVDTSNL